MFTTADLHDLAQDWPLRAGYCRPFPATPVDDISSFTDYKALSESLDMWFPMPSVLCEKLSPSSAVMMEDARSTSRVLPPEAADAAWDRMRGLTARSWKLMGAIDALHAAYNIQPSCGLSLSWLTDNRLGLAIGLIVPPGQYPKAAASMVMSVIKKLCELRREYDAVLASNSYLARYIRLEGEHS